MKKKMILVDLLYMCISSIYEAALQRKEEKSKTNQKTKTKIRKEKLNRLNTPRNIVNFFFFWESKLSCVCQTHTVTILIVLSIFHFKKPSFPLTFFSLSWVLRSKLVLLIDRSYSSHLLWVKVSEVSSFLRLVRDRF